MQYTINNFFNKYEYNSYSGVLTLSNNDSSNTVDIKVTKNADYATASGRKPEIYTSRVLNAENGSFAVINGGEEVYHRELNSWVLAYKQNKCSPFLIDYFDENIQYEVDKPVGYNGKKYRSSVDGTTIGVYPDETVLDMTFADKQEVEIAGMSGIVDLHVEVDQLIITATDAVYKVTDDGPSRYNETIKGSTSKVATYADIEARASGSNIVFVRKGSVINTIELESEISSVSAYDDVFYALMPIDGKVSVFKYDSIQEESSIAVSSNIGDSLSVDSSRLYIHSEMSSTIRVLDIESVDESNAEISVDVVKQAVSRDGTMYALMSDGKIYSTMMNKSEWIEIVVNDMFSAAACESPYTSVPSYVNIIVNSRYDYVSQYSLADHFCFIGNRSIISGANDGTGSIYKTDISNGIFSPVYTGAKTSIGHNLNGIAYFQGDLVVANWQTLKIYDPDTLVLKRDIDLQNQIEDSNIQCLSARGDTLYVVTVNGKMYKFSDVDAQVSGVTALELFTARSRVCVLDANTTYVSSAVDGDTAIWEMSSVDGSVITRGQINRGVDIDMDIIYGDFYTLDLEGRRLLVNFKRVDKRIEA